MTKMSFTKSAVLFGAAALLTVGIAPGLASAQDHYSRDRQDARYATDSGYARTGQQQDRQSRGESRGSGYAYDATQYGSRGYEASGGYTTYRPSFSDGYYNIDARSYRGEGRRDWRHHRHHRSYEGGYGYRGW